MTYKYAQTKRRVSINNQEVSEIFKIAHVYRNKGIVCLKKECVTITETNLSISMEGLRFCIQTDIKDGKVEQLQLETIHKHYKIYSERWFVDFLTLYVTFLYLYDVSHVFVYIYLIYI